VTDFKTIIEVLESQNVPKAQVHYILTMMQAAQTGKNPLSKTYLEEVATLALEAVDGE
jgi:hypothetical protein